MKKYYIVIILCIVLPNTIFAQLSNDDMCLECFRRARAEIEKKNYSEAKFHIDNALELYNEGGVYTDSINYYSKLVDYSIEVDKAEFLYNQKHFQDAIDEYNGISKRYKLNIKVPYWIERCNKIIEAQKNNLAITPKISKIINSIPDGYHPSQNFSDGVSLLEKSYGKGRYTYLVINKNWDVIPIENRDSIHMSVFSDGYAVLHAGIGLREGKDHEVLEYINGRGEKLDIKYKGRIAGRLFHEGKAAIKKDGLWGYIDKKGKEIIPPQYHVAYDFHEGLAFVGERKTGRSQYINMNGKTIIQEIKDTWGIMYDRQRSIRFFSEGLTFDTSGGAAYNTEGEKVFENHPFQHNILNGSYPMPFSCGMSMTIDDTGEKKEVKGRSVINILPKYKYGFINRLGEEVIPKIYDAAYEFHDNYAWVTKEGLNGCLNIKGDIKIPFEYEEESFHEADSHDITNFIDDHLLPMYLKGCHHGYVFSEGLAGVKKNGKWGFVDYEGNIIIPFIFEYVFAFTEGFAWVKKDGKWGLIDKFGTSTFDY